MLTTLAFTEEVSRVAEIVSQVTVKSVWQTISSALCHIYVSVVMEIMRNKI